MSFFFSSVVSFELYREAIQDETPGLGSLGRNLQSITLRNPLTSASFQGRSKTTLGEAAASTKRCGSLRPHSVHFQPNWTAPSVCISLANNQAQKWQVGKSAKPSPQQHSVSREEFNFTNQKGQGLGT
ncbi:hypothetical protein SUGI_0661640 [Cryptomeria japonica]|nr:hypothetical protein SUGI_0661640 [Cryptomeria japonica]